MFVITVDQVGSRSSADAVATVLPRLAELAGPDLLLSPERTAGDEFQLLLEDGTAALDAILWLTRSERWSVGCGVGSVRTPLPRSIREATGDAFVAARGAVERAKRKPTRFALASGAPDDAADVAAAHVEALIDLLLIVRARRSPEGWQLFDLVASGLSQAQAAAEIGISPQAASKRARAAEIRAELAVSGPLAKLLTQLGDTASAGEETRS